MVTENAIEQALADCRKCLERATEAYDKAERAMGEGGVVDSARFAGYAEFEFRKALEVSDEVEIEHGMEAVAPVLEVVREVGRQAESAWSTAMLAAERASSVCEEYRLNAQIQARHIGLSLARRTEVGDDDDEVAVAIS